MNCLSTPSPLLCVWLRKQRLNSAVKNWVNSFYFCPQCLLVLPLLPLRTARVKKPIILSWNYLRYVLMLRIWLLSLHIFYYGGFVVSVLKVLSVLEENQTQVHPNVDVYWMSWSEFCMHCFFFLPHYNPRHMPILIFGWGLRGSEKLCCSSKAPRQQGSILKP